MKGFFEAKSVAVVGISDRPGNLARNIAANLDNFHYQGRVFYVSPRGGEYNGQPVYKDVREIPEDVDLAAVLTPAATVPGIMEACGQKGIKRVIVESGGFNELDQSRASLAAEMDAAAARHGIRFIGPNCIGIISTDIGLALPFPQINSSVSPGGVSIVAQSGGVGLTYLHRLADDHIGIAKFAAVGNKQNVAEQDLLAYLIDDPQTKVIVMYLESVVGGREIFDLIRSTDKPVIVHKSNIAELSHAIASSHTAALANDDLVVESALAQCGAIRAHTVHDCLQMAKGALLPKAKGKRVAVVSRSGGHAVVSADAAFKCGFELPTLPASYLEPIQEEFRASVIKLQNPLDLGDLFNMKIYQSITEGALALDNVDSMLLVLGYRGPETKDGREFMASAEKLSLAAGKPLSAVLLSDSEEVETVKGLTSLPIFDTPEAGITALDANFRAGRRNPPPHPDLFVDDIDWYRIRRLLEMADDNGNLELPEALMLLRAGRIPIADFGVAAGPIDAALVAEQLGGPVAVKAVGADLSHKTEHGGVALNLTTGQEVQEAASDMFERLGAKRVLVMSMIDGGIEVIVGAKQDPAFGPLVLFGLGGVAAEAYGDVALRLAPVGVEDSGQMIDSIKASALLKGFRGAPKANRPMLMEVIMKASILVSKIPIIAELDINPLMVGPGGAVAVDARCRITTTQ